MLALLSNLNLVTRVELAVDLTNRNKCLTGSVLTWAGEVPAADGDPVIQVWSEANRSHEEAWDGNAVAATAGSDRFSPDVQDTGQLTMLYGKYRALTNMYTGTPTQGQFLRADVTTKLLEGYAPASGQSVANFGIVTKGVHTYSHLGKDYSVIEFVTI